MTYKLIPLNGRVAIERIRDPDRKKNGVWLPGGRDESRDECFLGKVTATGYPQLTRKGKVIPNPLKEGDFIIYGRYSGTDIRTNTKIQREGQKDEEYTVIPPDEVLCKLIDCTEAEVRAW